MDVNVVFNYLKFVRRDGYLMDPNGDTVLSDKETYGGVQVVEAKSVEA
jgi:hypothetical protein